MIRHCITCGRLRRIWTRLMCRACYTAMINQAHEHRHSNTPKE